MSTYDLRTGCPLCFGRGWLLPFVRYGEVATKSEHAAMVGRQHTFPIRCRCHPDYDKHEPVAITINVNGQQIEFCPQVDIATVESLVKDGTVMKMFYGDEDWMKAIEYGLACRSAAQMERRVQADALSLISYTASRCKVAEICVHRLLEGWDVPCTAPNMSAVKASVFEPDLILDLPKNRALIHVRTIMAEQCAGWGVSWPFDSIWVKPPAMKAGTDYALPCIVSAEGGLFRRDRKRSVYLFPPIQAGKFQLRPPIKPDEKLYKLYLKDAVEQGFVNKSSWSRLRAAAISKPEVA